VLALSTAMDVEVWAARAQQPTHPHLGVVTEFPTARREAAPDEAEG